MSRKRLENDPYTEDRKGGEIKSYKLTQEELEAYLKKPKEVVRRK